MAPHPASCAAQSVPSIGSDSASMVNSTEKMKRYCSTQILKPQCRVACKGERPRATGGTGGK